MDSSKGSKGILAVIIQAYRNIALRHIYQDVRDSFGDLPGLGDLAVRQLEEEFEQELKEVKNVD